MKKTPSAVPAAIALLISAILPMRAHASSSTHALLGVVVCTVPAQGILPYSTQYTILIDPAGPMTTPGAILKAMLPVGSGVAPAYMVVPGAKVTQTSAHGGMSAIVSHASVSGLAINRLQITIQRNVDPATHRVSFSAAIVDDESDPSDPSGGGAQQLTAACLGSNQS